jgi:agarase
MAHADDAPPLTAGAFRPGTIRGVEGFFRVGQDGAGHWWLIDPTGAAFFARAVHGTRGAGTHVDGTLPRDPAARLREWGFNALGVSLVGTVRDDGFSFLASAELARGGPMIVGPGVRLPDVFDPEWRRLIAVRAAEACRPLADCRDLIGWVTDDALEWAAPSAAGRPTLLQICLSLEPSFPAYHAAWEFVLALHGGRLEALAQAWNAPVPNKEMVRELTRAEEGFGTRGYLRDDARWAREFARRYFAATASALRAVDPHHLVFGCRFHGLVGTAVLAECAYPTIDVAMPGWTELPAPGVRPSQPVLASDVSWNEGDSLREVGALRTPRLTTIERMLRRGRAALARMARHPAVVGYAWSQWEDAPGEQPPFARGLIHVNGVEAREHTELLRQFNARAEMLRRGGPPLR